MAYVPADLAPLAGGQLENNQTVWTYRNSAGDTEATIKGAGFFSDAFNRRMLLGDLVIVFAPSVPAIYLLVVTSTPTKASPAATVAADTVIT